jgi:ketosteroid isomerase-like protein
MRPTDSELPQVIDRLAAATNDHDVAAIAGCFAEDYVNHTPAHPSRGFTGREQVRRNWEQILAGVPDLSCVVTRHAIHGDEVWTEWEHTGTRRDGASHLMRGIIVFTVAGEEISAASFYLEPVDPDTDGIDDAVRRHVGVHAARSR